MNSKMKDKKGFTLVEIIVVLVIWSKTRQKKKKNLDGNQDLFE